MLSFSLWNIALLFWFVLNTYADRMFYWVDDSCKSRPNWDEYLKEAFHLAERSAQRLADDTDKDYHYVFKRTFNTEKTDKTSYKQETKEGRLDSISKDWSEQTKDRLSADVRMYCNDGKRWTKSKKDPADLIDDENRMKMAGPNPCTKPGSKSRAFTITRQITVKKGDRPQNINRETIDFCDRTFTSPDPQKFPLSMKTVPEKDDLTKLKFGVQNFQKMVSKTILHEFHHNAEYQLEDIPRGADAYGWRKCQTKQTKDALNNAENYALFAVFALIADQKMIDDKGKELPGGYTLPRPPSDPKAKPDQKDEDDTKAGKFRAYDDLTGKRP
ncbi:MAG: hypothetical protein Q9160_008313 [Pyrenula sp. 1 TL-2023]